MKSKNCNPKTVPQIVDPPPKHIKCFNCDCEIEPGECHCGATVMWGYDKSDGWYVTGSIPLTIPRRS